MVTAEIGREGEIDGPLREQEMALLDPAVRRDPTRVRALLGREFREVGCSGRVWDLSSILEAMEGETEWGAPVVEDLLVERIDEWVALVTCRARRKERMTRRSSLWLNCEGRWRMVFHQGTVVEESRS